MIDLKSLFNAVGTICRDKNLREDLVQTAFVRMLQYKKNNVIIDEIKFLKAIVRNLMKDHLRSKYFSKTVMFDGTFEPSEKHDPEIDFEDLLDSLPPILKMTAEEIPVREQMEILGIKSMNSYYNKLSHERTKYAGTLGTQGR